MVRISWCDFSDNYINDLFADPVRKIQFMFQVPKQEAPSRRRSTPHDRKQTSPKVAFNEIGKKQDRT